MQLYIHVPFCRKKCHYCNFYSEALYFDKAPSEISNNDLSLKEIGVNLFTAKKEAPLPSNPYDLIAHILQNKDTAQKVKPKKKKEKALNSSPTFGKHPTGVLSLADILKSKKETHIGKHTPQKPTGPSLADALLSKDQAKTLRKNFGLPELESSQIISQKPTEKQKKQALNISPQSIKNLKSLIGGTTSDFVDLETANNHVRATQQGQHISTLEAAARMPIPKAFPENFLSDYEENHPLFENQQYKLWFKTLILEIKTLAKHYQSESVTSIFFGGGTPSLVPLKDMLHIVRLLVKYFHVTHNAEISLEANPESINTESAKAYMHMGFNRVSLGVQSLQEQNLESLGRIHSASAAIKAFHILRDARFMNISIDLMWGLPDQKNKHWMTDVKEAINLAPEHLSCYGLSIEEGSFYHHLQSKGKLELPEEKEQARMYKSTAQLLESAGYVQYEISNFAKIGHTCRHNMGYWQGEDYLGLGPSAASTVGNVRRTHASSLIEWAKDIQHGFLEHDILQPTQSLNEKEDKDVRTPLPHFTTEILSEEERVLECIMLRLRTTKGLALAEYKNLTGRSFMADHKDLIHLLAKNDLIRTNKGYIYLTPNGMLVSNSILERFFDNTKEICRSRMKALK